MSYGIVYNVVSPSQRHYVGITTQGLEKRKKEHFWSANSGSDLAFHNAIRKYDKRLQWFVIDEADSEAELKEKERKWISFAKEEGVPLYNGTDGGDGVINPTEEVRKKKSESMRGKTPTLETRAKLSESMRGRTHTPEHRAKVSEAQRGEKNHRYGKTPTLETRAKISEAKRGEKNYNYGKECPQETKYLISARVKARFENPETRKKNGIAITKGHTKKRLTRNSSQLALLNEYFQCLESLSSLSA